MYAAYPDTEARNAVILSGIMIVKFKIRSGTCEKGYLYRSR
jgi:hypothetical protein